MLAPTGKGITDLTDQSRQINERNRGKRINKTYIHQYVGNAGVIGHIRSRRNERHHEPEGAHARWDLDKHKTKLGVARLHQGVEHVPHVYRQMGCRLPLTSQANQPRIQSMWIRMPYLVGAI